MLELIKGLETWQLVVLAVAGIAFLWPRRETIFSKLGGMFQFGENASTPATAAPDANSLAAAYQLLAAYLSDETAKAVRGEVADSFLQPAPAAKAKSDTNQDAIEKILSTLAAMAASAKPQEEKP